MSARTLMVVCAFWLFALLMNGCSFDFLAQAQPSPSPTRTRRPTLTLSPQDTETPTATATSASTDTPTAAPATATNTEAPQAPTNTPKPVVIVPTNTRRPSPPTATFTPKPIVPTNTPALAFQLTFNWINRRAFSTNNECNFVNGTHVEGKVYRADGTLLTGARNTAAMHISITGDASGPFAYPGKYLNFPTENDGRWNADIPKRASDFEWKIFISPPLSDESISYDLTAIASAASKCGQPGTFNWFTADWVVH